MEDGVERRQIQLVDRAYVYRPQGEPPMRCQVIAEPHGVEHRDVVRRPIEPRLRQLRADISAAAGNEDVQIRWRRIRARSDTDRTSSAEPPDGPTRPSHSGR